MTASDAPAVGQPVTRGWRLVGIAGEVLITLGVLLLLAVVYELWWTTVVAHQDAQEERQQLTQAWEEQPAAPALVVPIPSEAFALMFIPRLQGDVWGMPLIEGVDSEDLAKGIGHFPGTAMPGEVGNTAFAGHRATHGQPLAKVDQLVAGDRVYIETGVGWYTYTLDHDELVAPTDVWVVDAVPGQPAGTAATQNIVTLVTCHPRWGSSERWVWWGSLTEQRTRDQGPPAELAAMLTGGG